LVIYKTVYFEYSPRKTLAIPQDALF